MVALQLKKRFFIVVTMFALFLPVFIPAGLAFAENAGGDGGTGGGKAAGCETWPSTCNGASWFLHMFEKGNLVLPGGKQYAKAANISQEQCHGAKAVFYYGQLRRDRTALGLTNIGGTPTWRSKKLGGGNNYQVGNGGVPWEYAKQQYVIAYQRGTTLAGLGYDLDEMEPSPKHDFSTLSWFCSNLEDEEEPEEPDYAEHECPAGFLATINYGNSVAESAVANLTKSENWTMHTSKMAPKNYTLAKPGDSVQFKHTYCYGASAVTRNFGYVETRYPTTVTNKFKIEAKSTNGGSKDYRFGGPGTNAPTRLQDPMFDDEVSVTVSISNGNPKASNLEGKVDQNADMGFTTYSPSKDAGNRYECEFHRPFDSAGYKFVQPGYQANGFIELDGNCRSYQEVKQKNDAGTTITQWLRWSDVYAWISDSYKETGNCTCTTPGNGIGNWELVSESGLGWPGRANYGRYIRDLYTCEATTCEYDTGQRTYVAPTPPATQGHYEKVMGVANGYKKPELSPRRFLRDIENEEAVINRAEEVKVLIPYNYDTSVSSSINASDTVYVGDYVDTSFNWSINPRNNPDVYNQSYATISYPSRVRIIEFMVDADDPGGEDNVKEGLQPGRGDIDGPCTYFSSRLTIISKCEEIYDTTSEWNPKGDPDGEMHTVPDSVNTKRQMPDLEQYEPGTKYCVAMGIWPSDSHNRPDKELGSGVNDPTEAYNGQRGKAGDQWRISGASCRTLYKKPNFQAWGAGIFTNGSIITSDSKKTPGAGMGAWNGYTHTFGSWDEYAVIARGEVKKFASAAGYGYEPNRQVLPTGGVKNGAPNFCTELSRLTLGGCNGDVAGKASSITIADTVIERLKSRYIPTSREVNTTLPDISDSRKTSYCDKVYHMEEEGTIKKYDYDACKELSSGATYIRVKDGGNISALLAPGQSGVRADGNVNNSGTIIIDATGRTINIGANICYLDGTCSLNNADSNMLRSNYTVVNNIASLPQVLIFAKNINIAQSVSQLDAWLIADNNINTCSNFVAGSYLPDGRANRGTNTRQCNATLNINGPVFAKSLQLNRTAGAKQGTGHGNPDTAWPDNQDLADDGSITPAEIFNLRPDTYYWAYSQAQRYSQAIVTYSRELAPRY